jgi:hypothetical protein
MERYGMDSTEDQRRVAPGILARAAQDAWMGTASPDTGPLPTMNVSVALGNISKHATFIDDRKAAEWAAEMLTHVILHYGVNDRAQATVTFTRG